MRSSRFEGKAAFVTGASSGLGAAVTRQLAAEGATVYARYRGHTALRGQPPATRVPNLLGKNS